MSRSGDRAVLGLMEARHGSDLWPYPAVPPGASIEVGARLVGSGTEWRYDMALTRWERFGLDLPDRWRRWLDFDGEDQAWLRVEELHEDGTLVIRAEMPGIDPDKDVDVSLTDGMLRISAKREERSEDKKKDAYRSEFRYGEFSRTLPMPPGVDRDSVKANYKDGILEVRMPWPEEKESGVTKVPVAHS
jgi:HSP20 family protein